MEKSAIGFCSGIYSSPRLLSNYLQLYHSSKTLLNTDKTFEARMSKPLTSSWERKCRNHQKSQAIKKGFVEREVCWCHRYVRPDKARVLCYWRLRPGKIPSFVVVGLPNSLVKNPFDSVWYNLSHHTADG